MLGPYYVNTDSRRRAAWGPPCHPALTPVIIAGRQYSCDVSVKPAFDLLEQIRARYGYTQTGTDTGFYNCRHMRHNAALPMSPHSWARALDWNWLQNPAGNKLVTDMPRPMIDELLRVKTMSGAYVFVWGGDWDRNPKTGHTYYDAMHWEVQAHPLDLKTGIARPNPPKPPTMGVDMILKPGDRGNAVKAIQQALNKWQPALDVLDDGIYGPGLTAAVKTYQTSADLPATGEVDGLTAALLLTGPDQA